MCYNMNTRDTTDTKMGYENVTALYATTHKH